MSKGPNTKDDPAEEDSERRLRRRRKGGGLRVPSDNVPRRPSSRPDSAEFPPPASDDPRLAVSVAYAFADERARRPSPAPGVRERPAGELESGPSVPRPQPDLLADEGDGVDLGEPESDELDSPDVDEIEVEPTESTDRSAEMPAADGEGDAEVDLTQVVDPDADRAAHRSPAGSHTDLPERPSVARFAGLVPDADSSLDYPLLEDDYDDPRGRAAGQEAGHPHPPDRESAEPGESDADAWAAPLRPDSVDIPIEEVLEVGSGRVVSSGSGPFGVATDDGVVGAADPLASPAADLVPAAQRGDGGALPDGAARPVKRARTMALSEADIEEIDDEAGGGASTDARWSMPSLEWAENVTGETDSPASPSAPAPMAVAPTARADGAVRPLSNRDAGDSGEIIDDELIEEIEESQRASAHEVGVRSRAIAPLDSTVDLDGDEDVEELSVEAQESAPSGDQAAPVYAGAASPALLKQKPPPAPATARAAAAAAAAAAADPSQARPRRRRGKPWFEDIFDEDYLRTLPFLTPQATQMEAQFVMDALGIAAGSQVLDVGCGYGRHAMELAARGYHVVGLDSSLPLLLRGADEAQRRGLTINFVHGDMRDMSFEAQFDGAYCLFSTFGYFDDETNKKTAQNVCRALKPGARCVFEVLNRDYIIAELPLRVWWEGDGCVVLEEVDFNYFSSRVISNRSVVFDDGRQLEQEISIRSFGLHELGKLLHSAGFRVVEVSGNLITRGRFFGSQSRDIVVVAERRIEKPGSPNDTGGRIP